MAKVKQDFEMYLGEDKLITFSITDADDVALDLVGSNAYWVLVSTLGKTEVILTKTVAGGSIDIEVSTYEVTLNAADTTSLCGGNYQHELRMIDNAGTISVLATGKAVLKPSLTNI